ncbi:hypothetical protein IQ07DRAFT_232800 [Pyrenochaeta sp. DS3sAY3a]|nr:hypothetical protein IQ07DRAFT_232800 [Pyrenochaeta sp. DS3sAY3a]
MGDDTAPAGTGGQAGGRCAEGSQGKSDGMSSRSDGRAGRSTCFSAASGDGWRRSGAGACTRPQCSTRSGRGRAGSTRRAREQPRRLLLQSWRCTASSGGRRRARTREPNLPCSGSRGRVLQQAQARKSETVIRCTSLCLHTPPLLSDLAPPNPVRPCCTSFLELATSQRDTLQAILVPGRYLRAHYSRRSQAPLGHAHLAPWNASAQRHCAAVAAAQGPSSCKPCLGATVDVCIAQTSSGPSTPADHSRVMTYMHAGSSVVEKHAEVL